jgi:hypothetical protein
VATAPADADYFALDPPDVTVTKLDDDGKAISVSPLVLTTTENGTTDNFSVALSAQPSGNVVINVASPDTGEVTVDRAQLIFTTTDWATPQSIIVTGVNDTLFDGDVAVTIGLTFDASNVDGTYGALTLDTPQVTNLDNERTSEGTAGAPLPLDESTSLPHEGTVNATGFSYYNVTGLTASTAYLVSVASVSDALNLKVYSDLGLTNLLCSSSGSTQPLPETCVATTPTGVTSIFLTVEGTNAGSGIGANYIVEVIVQPSSGEGVAGTPIDITADLPFFGIVDNSASFYVVTGLSSSSNFFVQLTGLAEDVNLELYSDADFLSAITCTDGAVSTITESCLTPGSFTGTELYIKVVSNSSVGAFFTIDVLVPPVDEGTVGSPIDITGLTPFPGQLGPGASGASFYFVENLIPGAEATVSITSITDDVELHVYDEPTFTNNVCDSTLSQDGGRVPETCIGSVDGFVVNPSGRLYIEVLVDNFASEDGATFDINVLQ